jgi:hypothetical protein
MIGPEFINSQELASHIVTLPVYADLKAGKRRDIERVLANAT